MLCRSNLLLIFLIVLSFIGSACQPTPVVVDGNNNSGENNVETNKDKGNSIRILYTANLSVHSPKYTQTAGGKKVLTQKQQFGQLATILKQRRNEGATTLTISSGNDFGGAFFEEYYGVATSIILDKIGYNIITPDDKEFSNGENIYDASIKDTNYNLLSAQTEYETRSLKRRIKPYVIKEISGFKVGILSSNNMYGEKFGVKLPVSQTSPNYVALRAEAINYKLKQMRDEGAEFTILMGDNERYYELSKMLNEDLLNVDIALFPSTNTNVFNAKKYDMQGALALLGKKKTPLFVYPAYQVQKLNVLQIDIEFTKDAEGKLAFKQSHKMIEIGAETASDPEIQKMVDEFISQLP